MSKVLKTSIFCNAFDFIAGEEKCTTDGFQISMSSIGEGYFSQLAFLKLKNLIIILQTQSR